MVSTIDLTKSRKLCGRNSKTKWTTRRTTTELAKTTRKEAKREQLKGETVNQTDGYAGDVI